jgi:hypothetical protein
MLDIHENDGQAALKAAGLFEEFLKIVHPGGQATRVLDKKGNVLFDHPDDGTGGRPEVPRGDLRRILLASLPADTLRWGHKLTAVSSLGDSQHTPTFENGSMVTTGLLVGPMALGPECVRFSPSRNRGCNLSAVLEAGAGGPWKHGPAPLLRQ